MLNGVDKLQLNPDTSFNCYLVAKQDKFLPNSKGVMGGFCTVDDKMKHQRHFADVTTVVIVISNLVTKRSI